MTPFLYALSAGLVMGSASIVEKLGLATTQPYAGMFVRAGAVAACLGISAIPFARHADWSGFTPRAIICLALGGILAGLIGHLLFWQSLKATSPEVAVPVMIGASQATVVLLSVGILRARVSLGQICGIACVVLGITLIQLLKPK